MHDLDTMVKDSKRFAATGGWGYGQFNYDAASDGFKPLGTGPGCGFACHTKVAAKDYVFTLFPKRYPGLLRLAFFTLPRASRFLPLLYGFGGMYCAGGHHPPPLE